MVHIRIQGGDTIGAFPVSDLAPTRSERSFESPVAPHGPISELVEVVSTSRSALRRGRQQSLSVIPVPRSIVSSEEIDRPGNSPILAPLSTKPYDYLLKFLLVGDSDVGKQEILSTLENAASDMPFCAGPGTLYIFIYKTHSRL